MSETRFDELPRWVDIAIAEHLLGLKVERKAVRTTPGDHLYGYEVTFFIEPDDSPAAGMVRWTYDDGACNFIAWRNGRDESDGNAPPLPLSDASSSERGGRIAWPDGSPSISTQRW